MENLSKILVNSIITNNSDKSKESFDSIMRSKLDDAIEAKKIAISSKLYNKN